MAARFDIEAISNLSGISDGTTSGEGSERNTSVLTPVDVVDESMFGFGAKGRF